MLHQTSRLGDTQIGLRMMHYHLHKCRKSRSNFFLFFLLQGFISLNKVVNVSLILIDTTGRPMSIAIPPPQTGVGAPLPGDRHRMRWRCRRAGGRQGNRCEPGRKDLYPILESGDLWGSWHIGRFFLLLSQTFPSNPEAF